ncbi:carboxymuconolactone decarboxylase family protein [Flavobacterium sp. LC2016-23]|uniref:carboxymuconolactone decarboxylase family protein n=1 Tax=Flavobacterium sp. LC2016-23 TaxID=2666330 RepID=UPI0012B0EE22|nr:carboxymuconolactone decarboxylase family protein [Flavobacterium sp. LC2016-23]MRX40257.1 carboxymuconolactone decarboxylase family protein [Flavobacterium sp. LC2016-23]
MARLTALNPDQTEGKSKELFTAIKGKMGMVPNMMRTMGNSPAVLNGYLGLSTALNSSSLTPKTRELISLMVANANGCDYCNAAHSFIGGKIGIDAALLDQARAGYSSDEKTNAVLEFAKAVLDTKGNVSDEVIEKFKSAGYEEEQIAEVIASVSLSIFTNYFNNAAKTDIDFPKLASIKQD